GHRHLHSFPTRRSSDLEYVAVVDCGREDVDEAEELGLERRVRHGPVEHPLAPPRALDDARSLPLAQLGDATSEGADLGFEASGRSEEHTSELQSRGHLV